MNDEPSTLIVMRLTQMHRIHPNQDESRICSQCGARVGIYPSGQAALKEHPNIKIICLECANMMHNLENPPLAIAAASIEDIAQEMRDSVEKKG
jgi:ribosomal protein L40E